MTSDPFQQSFKLGSPFDLAKQIGEDGIKRLLEIVCEAYEVLCRNHVIQVTMSEDEITEELFIEVEVVWRKSNIPDTIIPYHEKIDRANAKDIGKPPTIDFCFRHRWVKETYLGFECKRLAEGNNHLYKEYIENGLWRYLQGKYCAHGSTGSLIGYVISGGLAIIEQNVKARVDKERALKAMTEAFPVHAFKEHYVSMHLRERGLSPFCVHHLFFLFAVSD